MSTKQPCCLTTMGNLPTPASNWNSILQVSLFLREDPVGKQRYENQPAINGVHLEAGNIIKL